MSRWNATLFVLTAVLGACGGDSGTSASSTSRPADAIVGVWDGKDGDRAAVFKFTTQGGICITYNTSSSDPCAESTFVYASSPWSLSGGSIAFTITLGQAGPFTVTRNTLYQGSVSGTQMSGTATPRPPDIPTTTWTWSATKR